MPATNFSSENVGPDQLLKPNRPLKAKELDALWRLFEATETAWSLEPIASTLRSRWLDMIEARSGADTPYLPEYINAAAVMLDIERREPDRMIEILFFETIVTDRTKVRTRLDHAKFYVANDFIRCHILLGGFREFGGKNYGGFMGGSRFRDGPPVRTGSVQ